jgi:hypothetical protein
VLNKSVEHIIPVGLLDPRKKTGENKSFQKKETHITNEREVKEREIVRVQ